MPRKKNEQSANYNKAFPKNLRTLMEEKGATQNELANHLGKTRQAISYYCDGSSSPDWETLVQTARFFNVSADYLLGISKVKSPSTELRSIVEYTGLSEKSIQFLHFQKEIEFNDAALSIDRLLLDYRYHNTDSTNNRSYRPILNLLNYFFSYSNSGIKKQIYANGTIVDRQQNNFIPSNAIELNDVVIENAVLAEIQQALTCLKRNLPELEE